MPTFTVVGIGEALFDLFPSGDRLGGAPLNVAVHAQQLGAGRGGRGVVVSRVGQDELGRRVGEALRERGVSDEYLQTDPDRPTGRVYVEVDASGQPSYDIVENVAWDVLQFDPDLETLASQCEAVCFGSLAQRDAQSRNTILRFLASTRRAVRLFDVNLRGDATHRYYDGRVLRRSCEAASVVKLNQEELPIVLREMGMDATTEESRGVASLQKAFDLETVVLTRGRMGTRLYTRGEVYEGAPVSYPAAEGADSVGAGDACAAAVLVGRLLRLPPARTVDLANHVGAFVASQPGATPPLPREVLDRLTA